MVTRIMATVDAEYTEVRRVRIHRAVRQLAAEGRPCGGRLFGYVSAVDDDGRKTRAIVPHEAEAVRWAAAGLLQGVTLASVARAFDAKGMAHVRRGKTWSPTHIRSLVTNPTVAGIRPDPAGNLITAIWPPILDARHLAGGQSRARPAGDAEALGLRVVPQDRERHPLRRDLSFPPDRPSAGVCVAPPSAPKFASDPWRRGPASPRPSLNR